jgi:hypothetical protein
VVIRFPPFAADRLQENAEDTFVDDQSRSVTPARYGVSVIASDRLPDESLDATVNRMCNEASIGRGSKSIAVVTEDILKEAGFDLVADPNPKLLSHSLVGEQPFAQVPRVDALASLLQAHRCKNPTWTKGSAAA